MSDREIPEDDKVSRRDLLSQQFDAEAEEAEHGPDPEIQIHPGISERTRDEAGKFVAKNTDSKAEKPEGEPEPDAEGAEKDPPLWTRPPASWRKPTDATLWASMTPEAKQRAYEREEQMRAGVEAAIPKARLADEITKVAEPYMNTIRGMGADLPRAVKGLLEVDNILRYGSPEQKRAKFMELAQTYGVQMGQSQPGVQPHPQQQGFDPNYYALANQVNNLKGQIVSFQQAQEQQQQAAYLAEINQFSKTAEYFEEVRPTMVKLLEGGFATTLQDAYTKAIKLNDELSEQIGAANQAAQEKAQRETANRAAKSARAAAVSVKTSTPGRQAPTKAQNRREMLVEQFDGIDSRL